MRSVSITGFVLTGLLALGVGVAGAQAQDIFGLGLPPPTLASSPPTPASSGTMSFPRGSTVSAGPRSPENLRGWSAGYRAGIRDLSRHALVRWTRKATLGMTPEQASAFRRGVGEGMAKSFFDSAGMWRLGPSGDPSQPPCVITGPDGCFVEARYPAATAPEPCATAAADAFNRAAWRKLSARLRGRSVRDQQAPDTCASDVRIARLEGELEGSIAAAKVVDPTLP